jgi:AcrR family transcriptional regulator
MPKVTRPYHHGNLREALVDAGLELARTGGPDAVVLRAATRAAGVSHNAAYRHFADRDDLLAAVCERCSQLLADRMESGIASVRPARNAATTAAAKLHEVGRAYVQFALDEPGWFRTAFGVPRSVGPPPAVPCQTTARGPYQILSDTLDDMVKAGALPAALRPGAEYPAWSGVHGIATLLLDGPLRDLDEGERQRAIDRVLDEPRRRAGR